MKLVLTAASVCLLVVPTFTKADGWSDYYSTRDSAAADTASADSSYNTANSDHNAVLVYRTNMQTRLNAAIAAGLNSSITSSVQAAINQCETDVGRGNDYLQLSVQFYNLGNGSWNAGVAQYNKAVNEQMAGFQAQANFDVAGAASSMKAADNSYISSYQNAVSADGWYTTAWNDLVDADDLLAEYGY